MNEVLSIVVIGVGSSCLNSECILPVEIALTRVVHLQSYVLRRAERLIEASCAFVQPLDQKQLHSLLERFLKNQFANSPGAQDK